MVGCCHVGQILRRGHSLHKAAAQDTPAKVRHDLATRRWLRLGHLIQSLPTHLWGRGMAGRTSICFKSLCHFQPVARITKVFIRQHAGSRRDATGAECNSAKGCRGSLGGGGVACRSSIPPFSFRWHFAVGKIPEAWKCSREAHFSFRHGNLPGNEVETKWK